MELKYVYNYIKLYIILYVIDIKIIEAQKFLLIIMFFFQFQFTS